MPVGVSPRALRTDRRGITNPGADILPAELLPFVGRQQEKALWQECLRAARCGHGRALFLIGGLGVGKTRLARELWDDAKEAGWIALQGTGVPGAPEGFCLREAVRGLAQATIEDRTMGAGVEGLANILTQLAMGDARGLVLWVDDLHLADGESLRTLNLLIGRLAAIPLALIGTFPSGMERSRPELVSLLAHLTGHTEGVIVPLGPLPRIDLDRLLDGNGMALASWGQPERELLYGRTEGNPFWLLHTLHRIRADGKSGVSWLRKGDLPLSPVLRAAVRYRLTRLSPVAASLLATVAVMGAEGTLELLQAVGGWEDGVFLDALEELLDQRILRMEGDWCRFSPPLLQQVVYEELYPPRRQMLHFQVAQAMERNPEIRSGERILFRHYYLAGIRGRNPAIRCGRLAAQRTMKEGMWQQAADLLESVLLLVSDPGTRAETWVEFAEARWEAGDRHGAEEAFYQSWDAASALDESPMPLRVRPALELARRLALGEGPKDLARLCSVLQAATAAATGAQRVALLAYWSIWKGDPAILQEAVRQASDVPDPDAWTALLTVAQRAPANWLGSDQEEGLVREAPAGGGPEAALLAQALRARLCCEAGRMEEAWDAVRETRDRVGNVTRKEYRYLAGSLRVMQALHRGNLSEANGLLATELAEAGSMDGIGLQRAMVARDLGRMPEALPDGHRPGEAMAVGALTALHLWEVGRNREACDLYRHHFIRAVEDPSVDCFIAVAVALLAEACFWLGNLEEAQTLSSRLRTVGSTAHVAVGNVLSLGSPARYFGLLEAQAGRLAEAAGLLRSALAENRALGMKAIEVRLMVELAHVLVQGGQPTEQDEAKRLLVAARGAAGGMGMGLAASQREGAQKRRPPEREDGLTSRECEILQMVAGGRSTKEIAAELRLAVTTVQRHVASIYAKTGMSNRAQATQYAVRIGLATIRA